MVPPWLLRALGAGAWVLSRARPFDLVRSRIIDLYPAAHPSNGSIFVAGPAAIPWPVIRSIINNGHIAHEGPVSEIKAQPKVLERYLGV
jgi:hypothetical protein